MIGIDMKMPENCSKCKLEATNIMGTEHICKITEKRTTGVREAIREKNCPLVDIQDAKADHDKLEVGDEITCDGDYGVVTWIEHEIMVMRYDGSTGFYGQDDVKKTGRSHDEISAVLKKLKEAENEEK